jgi:hypothetical protein
MRIDVHAHYYPPALYDLLARVAGVQRSRGTLPIRGFSLHVPLDEQLELMTGAGIDRMVLSLGNTPPYFEERDVAAAVAMGANLRGSTLLLACRCLTWTLRSASSIGP